MYRWCSRREDQRRDFNAHHINASSVRAVERALARRGATGVVSEGALPGLVRWELVAPTPAPSIDIIIPTRDRIDLVRRCIDSIESKSTYPNYEIIILDNDSVQPDSHAYFDATPHSVVPCPGPFNYAAIVNRGVAHSGADFIVTLNNDTVVVTPNWLERLVALASLPDVGIVGAALVNQRGQHEHDGVVIAPYPQHLLTDTQLPTPRPLRPRYARRRGGNRRGADGKTIVLERTRRHG